MKELAVAGAGNPAPLERFDNVFPGCGQDNNGQIMRVRKWWQGIVQQETAGACDELNRLAATATVDPSRGCRSPMTVSATAPSRP